MTRTATVGVVGVGAATQAIHLPTIARLPGDFRVTRVTDVDHQLAEQVAAQLGAIPVGSVEDLLAGDGVDVVLICSPNHVHADQVLAAFDAGAGAVLCEKPLATSTAEAREIAAASRRTGVPLVVGTMHAFDPVWRAAEMDWLATGARAHSVRISAHIPPNSRSEDYATEVVGRSGQPAPARSDDELAAQIARVRGGVLGLSIHDLPLARRLLPDAQPEVILVEVMQPYGYLIMADVGGAHLELHAGASRNWMPDWGLQAFSDDRMLTVDFGLSYVHAGSAVAELGNAPGRAGLAAQRYGPHPANGYLEQWRFVSDVVARRRQPPDPDELADDLEFAARIADQSEDHLRHCSGAAVGA